MNKTKRIESIQGLRAVCFVAIFLSHTGAVDNNWGGWGVSVFLVMSGFLMYLSYCEKKMECSVKNCMSIVNRKVMRLYPLHLIMLVPAVATELTLIALGRSDESVIGLLVRLIPNALLIHTWFPDQSVYFGFNGVAWYLATYAFIVLSFLPLLCLMKKGKSWTVRKACFCLMGCICIPIIASFIMEFQSAGGVFRIWLLYVFPPMRMLDFFAGMQVGFLFKKYGTQFSDCQTTILEGIVIILCCTGILFIRNHSTDVMVMRAFAETSIVFMPLSCLLIYLVACEKGAFRMLLQSKLLTYIGQISVYAFLIHHQVVQYVHMFWVNFIPVDINVYSWSFVAFVITVVATRCYMKILERLEDKGETVSKKIKW